MGQSESHTYYPPRRAVTMVGYNERSPYYPPAYGGIVWRSYDGDRMPSSSYWSDGREYCDDTFTFQEPYSEYSSRYYDRSRSYDGRYGVTPMEQVYGRREVEDENYYEQHRRMIVELWVPMCCDKCERKVKNHFEDMEGVESVTTDQWTKKVVIVGYVRPDFLLSRAQRYKPASELWSARHRE